jgi:hypothetical protein
MRRYPRPIAQLIAHDQPASLIMQAFDGPLVIPLPAGDATSSDA